MKKILIVDDTDNIRRSIALCLKLHGYQTVEAGHGNEALKKVEQYDIGLILMDVVMPKLGGEATVDRIRERGQDMPVIFMSGYDRKSDGNPFLAKPFAAEKLLSEIEKQLSSTCRVCA